MEQWEPFLAAGGIRIEWAPFECSRLHELVYERGRSREKAALVLRGFLRRLSLLKAVSDYDAVYVFREAAALGPPILERRIYRSGKPLIFDFDDAVWVPYVSPANRYASLLKFPGKTRAVCRMARLVLAGNDYLAEYARAVNDRVEVVPTTIDTDRYGYREPEARDEPVIGWSGSYSTVQHLDTVRPIIERLYEEMPFRLRVVGTPAYAAARVPVDAMRWRAATEVQDLRPMSVGIMPLPDDVWSRGKCGLKALQYMALGIPAVCSPVGVNSTIVRDGENGFLAAGEAEWMEKIRILLGSHETRVAFAGAARRTVEAHYSARVQAQRVSSLIRSAAGMASAADRMDGDNPVAARA